MVPSQGSRSAATSGTTPAASGGLYEAAFHTSGNQPQCAVTLARSIDDARNQLADMLLLCDPGVPAVADITECTRARIAARYSGTAGEVFAQLAAAAPAVHHHPGTALQVAAALAAEGGAR